MTNDLRIVPSVATDEMRAAIENGVVIDEEFEVCNSWWVYEKTLEAAPDYSHLVIVERERLGKLEQIEAAAIKYGETDINDTNAVDKAADELWSLIND